MEEFSIEFDADEYFAGQFVTGVVKILNRESRKICGVKIQCKVDVDVHWTESAKNESKGEKHELEPGEVKHEGGDDPDHSTLLHHDNKLKNIEANNSLFNSSIYTFSNGRRFRSFEPGIHEFKFFFLLPDGLPSSYEETFGSVSYKIIALIEAPGWEFSVGKRVEKWFKYIANVDLNEIPLAREPGFLKIEKSLGRFCCKSGPIGITLRLPRIGYVPGEYIVGSIEIFNPSAYRRIHGMTFEIEKIVTFHAMKKTRVLTKNMFEGNMSGVPKQNYFHWEGEILKIPQLVPTKLGTCKIIDVEYFLCVEAEITRWGGIIKGKLPIFIGTVPFNLPSSHEIADLIKEENE